MECTVIYSPNIVGHNDFQLIPIDLYVYLLPYKFEIWEPKHFE